MTANTLEAQAVPYELFHAQSTLESLGPYETRRRWSVRGYSGSETVATLSSGMNLCASSCHYEEPLAIEVNHVPSRLEFFLGRGPGVECRSTSGESVVVGGGTFHVSQLKRPTRLCWTPRAVAHQETLYLEVGEAELIALLGTKGLPGSLARVLSRTDAYPTAARRMTPALFRLLDEVLYCDARGISRRPYLEAKALELLAVVVQEFEEAEEAASKRLTQWDVDRLQQARAVLFARFRDPPRLPELARQVGLNEAKLKAGFRSLFGCTVFACLRDYRMHEARRLLRARRYNVTEVALHVGYNNPSKFAAAFRKQFGISPSNLA